MEILGAVSEGFREKLWVLFISVLNYTTLFIIPGVLIHKSISSIRNMTQKYVIFAILFIFYIGTLIYWLIQDETNRGNRLVSVLVIFSASAQFNFVSKIGVGIISFLSGFSIVYMPFEYFRYFDPLITQINKQNIEETMQNILDDIRKEKMKLALLALESEEMPLEKQQTGFISGLMTRFLGTKLSKLERTIEGHKKTIKLNQQMLSGLFVDYSEISREENNYRDSTAKGCWHYAQKTLAICLLLYGCYKILTTVVYLFLGRNKPSDPISTGLKIGAA